MARGVPRPGTTIAVVLTPPTPEDHTMRTPTRFVAALAALGVAGLTGLIADEPRRPDGAPKAVTDAEFVTKAASGGMFEVLSGKMATEKATKAEVKAFAERMVGDHSKTNDELKTIATKAGLAVPSTLAAHHEKMLEQLKGAPNFDAAYMDAQLKAHAEAVALFTAASNSVKNADLRAFAEKTLPVLKQHYEHAKKHGTQTGTSR